VCAGNGDGLPFDPILAGIALFDLHCTLMDAYSALGQAGGSGRSSLICVPAGWLEARHVAMTVSADRGPATRRGGG